MTKKLPKPKVSEQLVEKFWELYPRIGSYSGAWSQLHSWSLADGEARGLSNPGQGWNSASGIAFENISRQIIVDQVNQSHLSSVIHVTLWDETPQDIREGILSELVWPKGQIQQPEKAESNVDLVATLWDDQKPIRVASVYSCKSSTAERYQQDLFWAEKLKARGIRFCFVTIEASFIAHATSPEAVVKPRKGIILAQAMYDRVYLMTEQKLIQNPSVFKQLNAVIADLDLWVKAY